MKKIKILLANRPRMMREVVREILDAQPDMEVVGEVLEPADLHVAVRDTRSVIEGVVHEGTNLLGPIGNRRLSTQHQAANVRPNVTLLKDRFAGRRRSVKQEEVVHAFPWAAQGLGKAPKE